MPTKKKKRTPKKTRKPKAACVHPCGIDLEAINDAMCRLEKMSPRLETNTVAIFEFTNCLARRCKRAKIPVTVWLDEEICDGIQLGFDQKLNQGYIPVVRDVNGQEVPRRHDATVKRCYSFALALHHASAEVQLAAMPYLNALFEVVLERAGEIAEALDEARAFNCMSHCCPFATGSRC